MWKNSCIVPIMNVFMMRQSINGYHFCVVKCVLSRQSIQGVAISTSGKRSVMSAPGSVSAAGGGSWSPPWRVCLRAPSPQPGMNTGCETDAFPRLDTLSFAMPRHDARSRTPGVTCTRNNACNPFSWHSACTTWCILAGQRDVLSMCEQGRCTDRGPRRIFHGTAYPCQRQQCHVPA